MTRCALSIVSLFALLLASPLLISPAYASPPSVTVTLDSDPHADQPLPVWPNQSFTLVANGQYEFTDQPVQHEYQGQATVEEQYFWDYTPAICETLPDTSPRETFHYAPENSGASRVIKVTYRVVLNWPNGSVDIASATAQFQVTAQGLAVTITQPTTSTFQATVGQPITFAAKVTTTPTNDVTSQATFAWDFGDGTDPEGSQVSHTYASVGAYTVHVTATLAGRSASAEKVGNSFASEQGYQPDFYVIFPDGHELHTDGDVCDYLFVMAKVPHNQPVVGVTFDQGANHMWNGMFLVDQNVQFDTYMLDVYE